MSELSRLKGYGGVCLNAALVLTLSWIPALFLLDGAEWATPTLGFLFAAPLALGARLYLKAPREEAASIAKEWAAQCFAPSALFAIAVQGVVLAVPHITSGVIVALMCGGLPLGIYGVMLTRAGNAAVEG
jgi:hypothetical protein